MSRTASSRLSTLRNQAPRIVRRPRRSSANLKASLCATSLGQRFEQALGLSLHAGRVNVKSLSGRLLVENADKVSERGPETIPLRPSRRFKRLAFLNDEPVGVRGKLVSRGHDLLAELIYALAKRFQLLERLTVGRKILHEQFQRKVLIAKTINGRFRNPASGIHQKLAEHHAHVIEGHARCGFHRLALGLVDVSEDTDRKGINGPDINAVLGEFLDGVLRNRRR